MKKLLFFALVTVALAFAGCKKEGPKLYPDDTPQTEESAGEVIKKQFDAALNDKDGEKLTTLLNEFSEKVKEAIRKTEPSEALEKVKEQLPIIQQWITNNKDEVIRLLGDKGTPIVETFLELKIPEISN